MPKEWVEHGQRRRLGDLKPHPRNARTHSPDQIAAIAASMGEWDWTNAILIDDEDMILAGHGRQLAGIEKFGADYQVPVAVARGWSDLKKRAYMLADNRLPELAGWNDQLLRIEIGELNVGEFDISLTGFDIADFSPRSEVDPEEAPEPPVVPCSAAGDVWLCGDHRVRCGDSTNEGDVFDLLGGASPLLMVTDPPYGVEYDANWRNERARTSRGMGNRAIGAGAVGKVMNDDKADWRAAWDLFPGDVAYVWHADLRASAVVTSLESSKFVMRAQIIWDKTRPVIGRGDYHFEHEPCWYAVRKGKTGRWASDRKQTTMWRIAHTRSETGHSTQKPIECMARPIRNNSKRGEAVYDPFLGSGTTMIAAEMERRRCLGMELNPAYVDVAVIRWQTFTGKDATLEGDGRTFAEVVAARATKKPRTRRGSSVRKAGKKD